MYDFLISLGCDPDNITVFCISSFQKAVTKKMASGHKIIISNGSSSLRIGREVNTENFFNEANSTALGELITGIIFGCIMTIKSFKILPSETQDNIRELQEWLSECEVRTLT